MIKEILPPAAVAVEMCRDPADVVLFAQEQAVLARAVEKRRREFTTARACARAALEGLGLPAQAIPSGPSGEPCWPKGIVGSITHCRGYRACAVARASELLTIGIDAEPHEGLRGDVLAAIALLEEREQLNELARREPHVHWDRLLFSAKESVYKAWFPLGRRRLGFHEALLDIDLCHNDLCHDDLCHDAACDNDLRRRAALHDDLHHGDFKAHLLIPESTLAGTSLRMLAGRWLVRDGLLFTAVAPLAVEISTGEFSRGLPDATRNFSM
jgi:4'-phosphopantetheinyl transferase EntD